MLFLVLSSLLAAVSGLPTNDARYERLLAPRDGDGGMLRAQFDFDPFYLSDMAIGCLKETESDPEFECTMQCKYLICSSVAKKEKDRQKRAQTKDKESGDECYITSTIHSR